MRDEECKEKYVRRFERERPRYISPPNAGANAVYLERGNALENAKRCDASLGSHIKIATPYPRGDGTTLLPAVPFIGRVLQRRGMAEGDGKGVLNASFAGATERVGKSVTKRVGARRVGLEEREYAFVAID